VHHTTVMLGMSSQKFIFKIDSLLFLVHSNLKILKTKQYKIICGYTLLYDGIIFWVYEHK